MVRVARPTLQRDPTKGEFEFSHIRRHPNSVRAKQHCEKYIPARFALLWNEPCCTCLLTLDEIKPNGLPLLRRSLPWPSCGIYGFSRLDLLEGMSNHTLSSVACYREKTRSARASMP